MRGGFGLSNVGKVQSGGATIRVPAAAGGGVEEYAGWYVAPGGSENNDGTVDSPWSLEHAISNTTDITPSSKSFDVSDGLGSKLTATIVWLRAGTYGSSDYTFSPTIAGSSDATPIILRAYPGERVQIDGHWLPTDASGQYLWFWNLDCHSSSQNFTNFDGFNINAPGVRVINCQVHDHFNNGVGMWSKNTDGQLYGTLVYNNGRRHQIGAANFAHNVYVQNRNTSTKTIKHNAIFTNFGGDVAAFNLHGFGSGAAFLENIRVHENALIGMGSGSDDGGGGIVWRAGTMTGGYSSVSGNMAYSGDSVSNAVSLGLWGPSTSAETGGDMYWMNNYMQIRNTPTYHFSNLTYSNNTLLKLVDHTVRVKGASYNTTTWTYDRNTYWSDSNGAGWGNWIAYQDDVQDFSTSLFTTWQSNTSWDANGAYNSDVTGHPVTNQVFSFANDYETPDDGAGEQSGFVDIFNWAGDDTVDVNVSSFLSDGDTFEAFHVFDRYGSTVTSGAVSGNTINVPMTAVAFPEPATSGSTTWVSGAPKTPGPEYGSFVVRKT